MIRLSFTMSDTITVTEAARNFSDVVNRVYYRGESLELIRGGKVVARLVPPVEEGAPTGGELLRAWKTIPHLPPDVAEEFAEDVGNAREEINQIPPNKWD